ncbi:MAG: hypothetical protein KDD02_19080 [Phaeodactylibacter sp.]|nr:hypothetical protein [Phaeodactylibacter sp.]MCB9301668.1 hypothetical protein [Lewinellaceae bacterium]
MAFRILYKTLFEVHLLSDYLLPDPDAFYTLSTGEDEAQQLGELLSQRYNILDFFSIEPAAGCQKLLQGHHMVFRTTPFGFLVAIKVKERSDGASVVFEPEIPPSPSLRLAFRLRLKETGFMNFSNIRVRPNVPAKFYFSNIDPAGRLAYPYLSLPYPAYMAGRQYEMGEWVEDGGSIYQALINVGSGVAPGDPAWTAFDSSVRYASYSDQRLLPLKFLYAFTYEPSTPIYSADFELLGSTDTGVGPINAGGTGEGPFTSFPLDFSEEAAGTYTLKVSSPEGYSDQKEILLGLEQESRFDFGLIEIGPGLGDFRLLESSGELRSAAGQPSPPAFRIAFRNRATYWQYLMHVGENLNRVNDSNFQTFPAERYIVTKNPILLKKSGQEMSVRNSDNVEIPLPSPAGLKIKPKGDRIYSEILLPRVNL